MKDNSGKELKEIVQPIGLNIEEDGWWVPDDNKELCLICGKHEPHLHTIKAYKKYYPNNEINSSSISKALQKVGYKLKCECGNDLCEDL